MHSNGSMSVKKFGNKTSLIMKSYHKEKDGHDFAKKHGYKASNYVKTLAGSRMHLHQESVNEDRMAGKYKKGQTIVRGQWPNPDKWAEEYIMPNADKKGVKIYSSGPSFVIEKL